MAANVILVPCMYTEGCILNRGPGSFDRLLASLYNWNQYTSWFLHCREAIWIVKKTVHENLICTSEGRELVLLGWKIQQCNYNKVGSTLCDYSNIKMYLSYSVQRNFRLF